MLTHIHIRDLATIEELHLNLHSGCTMITGETGAGKSIFIEAIELTLGGRSSPTLIRTGKEKAEISLSFDISNFQFIIDYLKNVDLYDSSPECILRRVITSDGRSRCYVNGSAQTLQQVKTLGDLLFHLHGQHEQQVLLRTETQRDMLDRYADHLPLVQQVRQLAEEWKALDHQIKNLHEKTHERTNRKDYLHFQLDELQTANLQSGEWEILEAEHHRLAHAEELMRNVQLAAQQITNEDTHQSALSLLRQVHKNLETIHAIEPKAKEWIDLLNTSLIQLNELESNLQHYLETTEVDPEKLHAIDARISQIFNLARKHKLSPPELVNFKEQLMTELNTLQSSDEESAKLIEHQQAIAKQYAEHTEKLSQGRKNAAIILAKTITATIRSLSLPYGELIIQLEKENTLPSTSSTLSIHGNEKINFLIKTNPDQTPQPLAKVISGGELSRLSLAAHLALANRTAIPTLIFDEIDTGLSGATAEKIGKLLRKLGDTYQVFCVTHQPQVAACGHHHLLVEKYFIEKNTHTRLRLLHAEDKTQEIARMLGGEKVTEKTLAHAKEILMAPASA